MPLNLGTGSTKDFVKFNSKADKWYFGSEQEIGRPTFVADLANIVTGWFQFREGQAPERRIDPSLDRAAPSPGEGFKRGFIMMVYSESYFGGAAEFSSASAHVGAAIRGLFDTWEKQRDEHPEQLPVVACTGSETKKDRYGTNFKPIFTIVKWVPRPADLPDESPVDRGDVWQGDLLAKPRPQLATPRPAVAEALQTEF